jgi:outer membrane protein, heavy metal efflux system
MSRTMRCLVLGALLAEAHPAVGEVPSGISLTNVVEEARQHNPEIKGARARAQAAAYLPRQAAAYDDPVFSYEAWNTPESFDIARADNNILKLSQRVPFPGKKGLAGTMAERDADVARREADMVELEVIAAVKRAYWDLWLVHQDLVLYSRDKDLVERFARIAEQKYAVGQVSQPDVLRAQVELTGLINRVTTETLAVDTARAELAALLSREDPGSIGTPESPVTAQLGRSVEALTDMALRQRPELAGQQASIARSQANRQLARLGYFPDFEFMAERFYNFERRDGLGAMVSISIPLVYKYKYDAAVSEANARIATAQADLRRLQDRVRREVQQAFTRAQTALAQRNLFLSTHIPQAEEALRASQIGYETGRVDFLSLIDSVRAIESVHVEHVRAEAEFQKAYADLERAVGGELPHEVKE